jgi:hypothetical protein
VYQSAHEGRPAVGDARHRRDEGVLEQGGGAGPLGGILHEAGSHEALEVLREGPLQHRGRVLRGEAVQVRADVVTSEVNCGYLWNEHDGLEGVHARRVRRSALAELDGRNASAPHVRAAIVSRLLDYLRRHKQAQSTNWNVAWFAA